MRSSQQAPGFATPRTPGGGLGRVGMASPRSPRTLGLASPTKVATRHQAPPTLSADSTAETLLSEGTCDATMSSSSTAVAGAAAAAFRRSLRLATEGASQQYLERAQAVLTASDLEPQLRSLKRTPDFDQALLSQGLELEDLCNPKLSLDRRVELLAAVLQECDVVQAWPTAGGMSPKSVTVLSAVEQSHNAALRQRELKAQQLAEAKQRQWEVEQAEKAARESKIRAKDEQLQRFQAVQAEVADERREEARARDDRRQQTVGKGHQLHTERRTEREVRLATKENKLDHVQSEIREDIEGMIRARQQLSQEQTQTVAERHRQLEAERLAAAERKFAAKAEQGERHHEQRCSKQEATKQRIHQRFERVQDQVDVARQLELERLEELESRHAEKVQRSQDLLQSCKEHERQAIEERHERRAEKEHQVLRMARLQQHQRFVKLSEHQVDMVVHSSVSQIKERLQSERSGNSPRHFDSPSRRFGEDVFFFKPVTSQHSRYASEAARSDEEVPILTLPSNVATALAEK